MLIFSDMRISIRWRTLLKGMNRHPPLCRRCPEPPEPQEASSAVPLDAAGQSHLQEEPEASGCHRLTVPHELGVQRIVTLF